MPASIAEALQARPEAGALPIAYREEIFHPAFPDPLIARGTFDLGRDGALIRHQAIPTIETTEIRERFITIRREAEGFENVVPIPPSLDPLLAVLRAVITPEGGAVLSAEDAELLAGDEGWTLALVTQGGASGRVTLSGCGAVLASVGFEPAEGERRKIILLSR
ncbi:hypothetical protein KHP62_03650 [Rhodobacteraceae bacterium NNCM2]|nr:hypothetical protein [Coraliihabitans acroporae]